MSLTALTLHLMEKLKIMSNLEVNNICERAEIGKQTGLKILRVVTPYWVQVPPLAPIFKRL